MLFLNCTNYGEQSYFIKFQGGDRPNRHTSEPPLWLIFSCLKRSCTDWL